jgi:hypothetical protein
LFAIRFQFDGIFAQHLTFQIVQPILNTLSDFSMNRIAAERCKRYAHKEECLNMKKISRRSFLTAAAVSAAALALTACGGSASSAASSVASSAASSEAAALPPLLLPLLQALLLLLLRLLPPALPLLS